MLGLAGILSKKSVGFHLISQMCCHGRNIAQRRTYRYFNIWFIFSIQYLYARKLSTNESDQFSPSFRNGACVHAAVGYNKAADSEPGSPRQNFETWKHRLHVHVLHDHLKAFK